ncbi:acyl-CoA carboxylase subunit epsilon [Nocardia amamiensis]|uniref:acyl-CoA carboxylase subunit epsilon n=1 Tax=Nocardia amamiensis TaxID=404578 RepID=UPI0027D78BD2|nr:acyl-CoA carboxylase subunit epsilon [Nocardia amamiensis]
MAEEDVLSAVELDLAVDPLTAEVGAVTDPDAAALPTEATAKPLFRVVKGSPTDEELAALVCVLSALASDAAPAGPSGPPDMWGRPTLMHRGSSPFSPYAFPQLSHLRG